MDVNDLSSNWKRLQQSLKSDKKPAPAADKRAANGSGGPASKKRKAGASNTAGTGTSTSSGDRRAPLKLPPVKKRKITIPTRQGIANGSQAGLANGSSKHARKLNSKSTSTSSSSNTKSRRKMGILSSAPIPTDNPNSSDSDSDVPISTAIEDIPHSQRALALQASTVSPTSLVSSSDRINSGLVPSVKIGRYVAVDCEMVGVGPDPSSRSMLARVSLVNFHGEQVYDSFVAAKEPVTDYRTAVSGITEALLRVTAGDDEGGGGDGGGGGGARSFEAVQADVAAILDGRVLVGHAVRHDLDALMLGHPRRDIRDTSRHAPYRDLAAGRTPALKRLARELLGVDIQAGAHSSVEDARATMMLYKRDKDAFERDRARRFGVDRRRSGAGAIDGEVTAGDRDGVSEGAARGGHNRRRKKKKGKK